jgi:Holliday junction resolvase
MVRRPKGKGNAGEREVIDIFNAHGWNARRNFASGGYGGNDLLGVAGYAIEIKRQERLNIHAAYAQCLAAASPTETPVVVCRRSREPWMAYLELAHLIPLMKAVEL